MHLIMLSRGLHRSMMCWMCCLQVIRWSKMTPRKRASFFHWSRTPSISSLVRSVTSRWVKTTATVLSFESLNPQLVHQTLTFVRFVCIWRITVFRAFPVFQRAVSSAKMAFETPSDGSGMSLIMRRKRIGLIKLP